jgi:preprotein translocase subunit SecE
MSNTSEKSKMKDWFKAVRAQFRRIIWPTKEEAARETAVVVVITLIIGAVIALLDRGLLTLVDLIITL